jgi:predicted dehydrogenase
VLGEVDAVIVAVPQHLHHAVAGDALSAALPVLCEKPLATTLEDAEDLVLRAREARVPLAVNNTRRLFPSMRHVRTLVAAGEIGRLRAVSFREGARFSWPSASASYFRLGNDFPRGVLMDRGSHVVDLACWWLDATPDVAWSKNDSRGGPEGIAAAKLVHDEAEVDVYLSWLSSFEGRFRLEGERGVIEGSPGEWWRLDLTRDGRRRRVKLPAYGRRFAAFADELVDAFLGASAGAAEVPVTGDDVLRSLAVIEEAYRVAQPFDEPWDRPLEALSAS